MYSVYILQSLDDPTKRYVGSSGVDLHIRLVRHNEGLSPSTARYRPWEIVWSCSFKHKDQAVAFENYLKSGSGRAFAAKRLLP
jgi:predicted GIY-YIG superfamily endonuclease